jgi:hypothetical protein
MEQLNRENTPSNGTTPHGNMQSNGTEQGDIASNGTAVQREYGKQWNTSLTNQLPGDRNVIVISEVAP